jgi:hypothetical protein
MDSGFGAVCVAYLSRVLHLVLVDWLLGRAEAQVAQRWLGKAHTEKLINTGAGCAGPPVRGIVEVDEWRAVNVCREGDCCSESASDAHELHEEHHDACVCLCKCVHVCMSLCMLFMCASVS